MTPQEFKQRTKLLALRVMRLADSLPQRRSADVIGRQLLRSATSIGANYRAACRARSTQEFRAKLGIVEEEADETAYWIELLVESELVDAELVQALLQEVNEITAMIVASIKTSRYSRQPIVFESAIRNPQSAIRNPQSAIHLDIVELAAYCRVVRTASRNRAPPGRGVGIERSRS